MLKYESYCPLMWDEKKGSVYSGALLFWDKETENLVKEVVNSGKRRVG